MNCNNSDNDTKQSNKVTISKRQLVRQAVSQFGCRQGRHLKKNEIGTTECVADEANRRQRQTSKTKKKIVKTL